MLALSVQSPLTAPPRSTADAVARALDTAGTVSGAYTEGPCRFLRLDGAAAARLGLRPGRWVLVAARRSVEAGHRAHLRERCLTAAQRVLLALACEGVESEWVGEGVPDEAAFRRIGVELGGAEPVGLVWCAAG